MKLTPRFIVESEANAIKAIPKDNPYAEVIDLLFDHCHQKRGKVVITGVGKAGYIAQNMAVTFNSGGTNAQFLNPLDAVHGDLGLLGPDDVLIAISNSGKTREIVELIPLAQNLSDGIPIISITGQGNSDLTKLSAYVLLTGNPNEVCPLGKTPTTSKTAMSVISDIITMGLMEKIGLTMEEYAKRHHGGYLGQQARAESSEGLDLKKDG